ncbi:hypothetical protein DC430_23225 [Rhizobium rhizogenes]|uniref:GrpB family protein n=1 Tax=Rhizobium rhizogenes TaxID=359 RepID=A0AA92BZ67_RHIRH|nr:hypothetical protein DC430_23225 [Rhizobium rhizogenes]
MGTLVKIVPYNADWPRLYRDTQNRLEALLGDLVEGIEHVGSTAVPGLAAKPYIDIDVVLKHSTHMEDGRARMQAAGLEPRGSRHGDGVFAFMLGIRCRVCAFIFARPIASPTRTDCVSVISSARTPLLPITMRRLRWLSPRNIWTMAMPIPAPSPTSFARR